MPYVSIFEHEKRDDVAVLDLHATAYASPADEAAPMLLLLETQTSTLI